MAMTQKFVVLIEKDDDGMLVAKVPTLPGCHTQAKTMSVLMSRVKEAIVLCLGAMRASHKHIGHTEFVGLQQIEILV